MPQEGPELREQLRQLLLGDGLHELQVQGGEAGGIRHVGFIPDGIELHVAGGMAAPAQLLGDRAGLDPQLGAESLENGALAHAGVPRKGHGLSGDQPPQGLDPQAGLGAGADHGEARGPVQLRQGLRGGQIRLIDADQRLHPLAQGQDGHAVDEEGLRHRDRPGGQDHQLVHVGHGGPEKAVSPGQDLCHRSLSRSLRPDLHPVPHQGGFPGFAEFAPSPALQKLRAHGYVIEA